MEERQLEIERIPAVLYGRESEGVWLFLHGKHGHKEEARELADIACRRGWQVLGVDLPGHGQRSTETDAFDPWHVVPELRAVLKAIHRRWSGLALCANSIGAWFGMQAFSEERFQKCLFLSPVLDMEELIHRMMGWAGVDEEGLRERGTIETAFGETLSWQYLQYAKDHPVQRWNSTTSILYGDQDNLTERQTVDRFTAQFSCDLTVLEGGEHWFHTEEQMEVVRRWMAERVFAQKEEGHA